LTTKASETWKMEGVAPSVCSGGNEGKKKKQHQMLVFWNYLHVGIRPTSFTTAQANQEEHKRGSSDRKRGKGKFLKDMTCIVTCPGCVKQLTFKLFISKVFFLIKVNRW